MNRRSSSKSYLMLFATILLAMSLSKGPAEKIRNNAVSLLANVGEVFNSTYSYVSTPLTQEKKATTTSQDSLQQLRLENHLLQQEVRQLQEILKHEQTSKVTNYKESGSFHQRRNAEYALLSSMHLQSIPAQVIFRSPASWNSSMWINVGTTDNERLGRLVVSKNSPVIVGTSVVGVIDFAGKQQSRVRLITDSGLKPSVRAVRKDANGKDESYLAKGEIHGSSQPLWRKQGQLLKGIGFNYDFADEEGPARDLRNGLPSTSSPLATPIPLIKVDDLLTTTGMDGLFPPGLSVAQVLRVYLLKEGDYYFELEARPTAGDLDELSLVFVLPPIGYDPAEQPPTIGR